MAHTQEARQSAQDYFIVFTALVIHRNKRIVPEIHSSEGFRYEGFLMSPDLGVDKKHEPNFTVFNLRAGRS